MRIVRQYIVCFYCLTPLLTAACGEGNHRNLAIEFDSLESLKIAFDHGMITHVDFKTVKQGNILNDKIIGMELVYGDETTSFLYMKLSSLSENGELHTVRLTLDHSVTGSIAEDMAFAPWVETLAFLNGKENTKFRSYVFMFESGITSSGLNILSDTLQINFHN